MPNLSDPLGAPKIVTGVDYMDALARLGYNVENMTSPIPIMANIAKAGTSLIDQAYTSALNYQKSQADLAYSVARTKNLDSETDYNNQSLDLRLKDLELQNQTRQQNLTFAQDAHPINQQILRNQADGAKIALDAAQRNAQDQNDALALIPEATSALPDPDDPNYVDKRDQWRLKYNRLLTNPATRTRMEGEFQAVDGIYQSRILSQETAAKRKEFGDLQMNGFIPSPINPDQAMKSPDADNLLTKGRMLQARHQVEGIAAMFPEGDPNRQRLQTILDEADKDTGSDTGVQDVTAGKSRVFDTNGRLTGVSAAAIQQAQNTLAAQAQAAGKEIPKTTIEVPLGKPNVKGEYPSKMTISGVSPSVGEELAQRYGLTPQAQQQPARQTGGGTASLIQDPAVRDLAARYQRREITRDQFLNELQKLPTPTAPSTNTGASQQPNAGAVNPARTPTSNNDYTFPDGASNHAGIDANVWANVMSEEGREFGKDGSHDSVFGLWADAPGIEGEAYRAVKENGPNSLAAYNAVTNAWTNKFLRESQPWNLTSPGLQELVIADSQHVGGDKARAIIDQMGGYDKVNSMPAEQAIREYSELRKPLWPGNNKPFPDGATDRVTREKLWALRNDQTLRGAGQPVARLQTGGLVTGEPGPDQVPAMLTSGEYVVNKDAVQDIGLPTLEALNQGTSPQPATGGLALPRLSSPATWPTVPSLASPTSPLTLASGREQQQQRTQSAPLEQAATAATVTPSPALVKTGQSQNVLTPQSSDQSAFTNAHYLGDGRLAGIATNFGHDVNGKPDQYMLKKFGPGSRIGAFGTDVVNPNTSGVSIPISTFKAFIGDPKDPAIRKAVQNGQYQVEVTAPNGNTQSFPIVDLGPGPGEAGSIDMTGTAMRRLGVRDNFSAVYRIVRT